MPVNTTTLDWHCYPEAYIAPRPAYFLPDQTMAHAANALLTMSGHLAEGCLGVKNEQTLVSPHSKLRPNDNNTPTTSWWLPNETACVADIQRQSSSDAFVSSESLILCYCSATHVVPECPYHVQGTRLCHPQSRLQVPAIWGLYQSQQQSQEPQPSVFEQRIGSHREEGDVLMLPECDVNPMPHLSGLPMLVDNNLSLFGSPLVGNWPRSSNSSFSTEFGSGHELDMSMMMDMSPTGVLPVSEISNNVHDNSSNSSNNNDDDNNDIENDNNKKDDNKDIDNDKDNDSNDDGNNIYFFAPARHMDMDHPVFNYAQPQIIPGPGPGPGVGTFVDASSPWRYTSPGRNPRNAHIKPEFHLSRQAHHAHYAASPPHNTSFFSFRTVTPTQLHLGEDLLTSLKFGGLGTACGAQRPASPLPARPHYHDPNTSAPADVAILPAHGDTDIEKLVDGAEKQARKSWLTSAPSWVKERAALQIQTLQNQIGQELLETPGLAHGEGAFSISLSSCCSSEASSTRYAASSASFPNGNENPSFSPRRASPPYDFNSVRCDIDDSASDSYTAHTEFGSVRKLDPYTSVSEPKKLSAASPRIVPEMTTTKAPRVQPAISTVNAASNRSASTFTDASRRSWSASKTVSSSSDADSDLDDPFPSSDLTTAESQNAYLIKCKQEGMTYKEIRRAGGFKEAESTLRGRYRALTKQKGERVRKPQWKEKDVRLLEAGVRELAKGSDLAKAKIPWKEVAGYIVRHGGSYLFGNSTCRKRWDSLVKEQIGRGKSRAQPFF